MVTLKQKKIQRRRGKQGEPQGSMQNPFEQIRSRKKFDVLGKKTKGTLKRTTQLRSAATEKRKDTLLVEYRQLKKNNAFVDRRFGENDEGLTQEEKALLRFQKQRSKELASSKFALGDEQEDDFKDDVLTHLGQSIVDTEGEGPWSTVEEDDGRGNEAERLLEQYHFGGGGTDEEDRHKTKKEIMEEVIAKSKMFKAMKAKEKEGDLEATAALDDAWKEISQNQLAGMVRPTGSRVEENMKSKALMTEDDRKFDAITRELVFEAKAQAGDRTLTKEELADLERQRLEELEKQRVTREQGGDDGEDDFGGIPIGGANSHRTGGYAGRRARLLELQRREVEDDDDNNGEEELSESDEDGLDALERRRRERAAGDHHLQQAFRGVATSLLKKHLPDEAAHDSEDETQEDNVNDSMEDDEKDEMSDHSDSGKEDQMDNQEHGSDEESDQERKEVDTIPTNLTGTVFNSKGNERDSGLDMTFTPSLPESYPEFLEALSPLSPIELGEMIRRIREYNAQALAESGRKKLQTFYGCILQYFVSLAGEDKISLERLDALVPHIVELTPLIPFYSGMLARARIEKEHSRMRELLKDTVGKSDAWIRPRAILLARLFCHVFPVTDRRHPVLTPLGILLGAALTLCPIARPSQVGRGLLIAHILTNMHAISGRYVPETLEFASKILKAFGQYVSPGDVDEEYFWITSLPKKVLRKSSDEAEIPLIDIGNLLGQENDEYFETQDYLNAILCSTLGLVRAISETCDFDAYPEIFAPILPSLKIISSHTQDSKRYIHRHVLEEATALIEEIETKSARLSKSRRPMSCHSISKAPQKKQFNPRFEDDFVKGKDYDPDRERAERKRLVRQLRKEERGAIRELRKDAVFMADVRDREKTKLQNRLDQSAKRAISFLQQQESDFKSGGQGGMWKKKKKK